MIAEYKDGYLVYTKNIQIFFEKFTNKLKIYKQNQLYYPYGEFLLYDTENNVIVSSYQCPQFNKSRWKYYSDRYGITAKINHLEDEIYYSKKHNLSSECIHPDVKNKNEIIHILWLKGNANKQQQNESISGNIDNDYNLQILKNISNLLEKYEKYEVLNHESFRLYI